MTRFVTVIIWDRVCLGNFIFGMPFAAGEPPALVSVPTHFYKVVLLEAPSTQGGK